MKSRIILASASPRRQELLTQIGLTFEVCPSEWEEVTDKELPEEVVQELSYHKAMEVYERNVTEEGTVRRAGLSYDRRGNPVLRGDGRAYGQGRRLRDTGRFRRFYTGDMRGLQ